MALRELFVGIGAMVPLAAAGCGPAAQQVQTSPAPTASAAPGASAPAQGAPPNAQPPRQGFIPALLGIGDATQFFVQSGKQGTPVPSGTTCSGRVSWNGPNAGSKALPTTSNPSWHLVPTPAGATRVTWHVDCSQLDQSQGVTIQRSQPVEMTFTVTTTGSSARNAQP